MRFTQKPTSKNIFGLDEEDVEISAIAEQGDGAYSVEHLEFDEFMNIITKDGTSVSALDWLGEEFHPPYK
jgi:hypothetical protein